MKSHRWRYLLAVILLGGAALMGGTAFALDVGDKAPNFALPSNLGKEIKLADFLGNKALVLFFYVAAFTGT